MGALDWSASAAQNATADVAIAVADGTSGRQLPASLRGIMASIAALASDQGGALVTSGTADAFVLNTATGVTRLRPGVRLTFVADRTNGGPPTLTVDGLGPKPWLGASGAALAAGAIAQGEVCTVYWTAGGWRSGATTVNELAALLAGKVNPSDLAAALADKVTASQLANGLSDKVTQTQLASGLLTKIGSSDVPNAALTIGGSTKSLFNWVAGLNAGAYSVTLQAQGGADDASTANDAALSTAKALGRLVVMPQIASGIYNFTGSLSLANTSLNPEPGVVLRSAAGCDFAASMRTTRAFLGSFRVGDGDTVDYTFRFTPDHGRSLREKTVWLTESDIDRTSFQKIDPSSTAVGHWTVANGTDTWSTTVPNAVTDHEVTWNLQADNVFRATLLPMRGGQELQWARSGGVYNGGALIRTTAGYYIFSAGNTGTATLRTKLTGQAQTFATNLGWPGIASDGAWYAGNAVWGVVNIDGNRFAITINGYMAFGPYPVVGEIVDAGPCFFGSDAITVSASWPNRAYRSTIAGGILSSILALGDSTVAPAHGDWATVMSQTLDGLNGIRVTAVNNYGVGGHSSGDQWNKLSTLGVPPGTTHAVILVGRNDISGGASADGFTLGYYSQMIDYLTARSIRVVVCVPFLAYKRGTAGGRGVNVVNDENSARTQMLIAALGASKGVKVVDLNRISGPLIGAYAADAYVEPFLRDNLHQSDYGYKLVGIAVARALADLTLERMGPECVERVLPSAALANVYGPLNGWTIGVVPLTYSIVGSGKRPWCHVRGRIVPGTRAATQQVYQMPLHLQSAIQQTAQFVSDAADVTGILAPTGIISVLGMASTGSYCDVDFAYPLA